MTIVKTNLIVKNNELDNTSMYKELFLKRWKEMEDEIILEKEDGETTFLEKDVFSKFFTSPELLVGFYIWRGAYGIKDGYYLFMEEYDGWIDDCKEIASKAKEIFEREINQKNGENNIKLNLNTRILEVLYMVYHYKSYRSSMAILYPEQKINWYEDTRKFYFGLDLPEGLNKNEIDFKRVMQFHPDSKPYSEWMETNEDELDKFVWKN